MKYLTIFLFMCNMLCLGLHYYAMLQLDNYKIKINQKIERFFLLTVLSLIASAIAFTILTGFLRRFIVEILLNFFLLIYFVFISIPYLQKRNKLVFTPRAVRMYILYGFISLLLCGIVFIERFSLFVCGVFFILIINPFICFLAYAAILPFEVRNNRKYIERAKVFLDENKSLIKIGITGSYAKTSCKNILYEMLSSQYNVCATKASYNTPLGIAKAVGEINKATDIFIAEMGARKLGDIKELVDIVKPKYAIITGVTRQHMQTFGTIENIYREKQELVSGLPQDGFCVFNGENSYTKFMYYKCKTEKCIVGFDNTYDYYAENIQTTDNGSFFDLVFGDKRIKCTTCLLGRHNILNILLAAAMAKKFGIEDEKIAEAIERIKPIKHRLELINSANGITIIDDSYNCNIDGAVAAFEVLRDFCGRKVIFSQGIVELGDEEQYKTNLFLGKLIAKSADMVILCGSNANAIKTGLNQENFAGEIKIYKGLKQAQNDFCNILAPGDILLIQNDLPDNL